MKTIHIFTFLLTSFCTIALSACGEKTTRDASEIRFATFADLRSSYPGVNRDAYSDDILTNVVEPLVVHRADLSIAPMAASHYEISDDNKTFQFVLREGLTFHNGEEVFAHHVKMNWEKILDPKTGFQCLPFYNGNLGAKIEKIEVNGPKTITFHLDKPSSVFLEQLAYLQCPVAILHPDSWNQEGKWIKPIGTGPFKFTEWQKGRHILLQKYDGYIPRTEAPSGLSGSKVSYVDAVKFIVIPDKMAAKAAIVSGQIDIVTLSAITALELRSNKRVRVLDEPGLARQTMLIQTDDELLSNVLIRRAIAQAIDLEMFAKIASLDLADPNPSTIPTGSYNHTPLHSQPHEFNPKKAKELLKKAGYNGEEITIKTTKVEQPFFDTAMIASSMLTKVGINIKVEVLEFSALLGDYFEGDYQLMAFEYTPRLSSFMSYHSLIGNKKITPNRWGDQRAIELLTQAAMTFSEKKRQDIYDQIHILMMEEVPVINLYNTPLVEVTSKRIEGYEPWKGAKPRLWNVKIKNDQKNK